MFGEATEEEKRKKKRWFQSLSLISSEEESNDDVNDSTSNSSLFIEVQNAYLRFPYPIFNDDSDEEFETCASNNQGIIRVAKRSETLDCLSDNSQPSWKRKKKLSCENSFGHAVSFGNFRNPKHLLQNNQSSNSKKSKFKVRDELRRVWNYTKKKKRRHIFRRPGTVLSTSEDETEPKKKRRKKIRGRKPAQLKMSSSEENLVESMVASKSELKDNSCIDRSFSKFIDSSSNSETSECNVNKLTSLNEKRTDHSFHNLSSSNNSSDDEPVRSQGAMDTELRKTGDKKRTDHSISSSEEETKKVVTYKNKTNITNYPSAKKITYIPSKHQVRNLITAQQLQEDNRKMKKGLKPILQKVDKHIEDRQTSPLEIKNKPSLKVDYSPKKKMADLKLRTNGSKMHSSHNSKLKNLKKHFISSNKSSVELSKQIRSNMNLNTKDKTISNSHTTRHKHKTIQRLSVQTKQDGSNSNTEETTRVFSKEGQKIEQKEARYTVNDNVGYNQSDTPKSVQDYPEDDSSNKLIGKESSQKLDINISVIQEEDKTKSTCKKVRISHTNKSKNKLENKPHILCESNSESKLNRNNLLNRGCHSSIKSNEKQSGQFDLVGNIISQMKVNPYPCHIGRRKSLEQGTDALGWFSNPSPISNTEVLPMMSNTVCDPSKRPVNYSSIHMSSASQSSNYDPSYHQLPKPPQTSCENQDNTISKSSLYISNVSSSIETDKGAHSVPTLAIANKHSSNEVLIPFYSANHNDYKTGPENSQTNIDNSKSGLDTENLKRSQLCIGDRSSVQSHLEGDHNFKKSSEPQRSFYSSSSNSSKPIIDSSGISKTSNESSRYRKSESGSTVTNTYNTNFISRSNLAKTYQTQQIIEKNSAIRNGNNVSYPLRQTPPIKSNCPNNDYLKKTSISDNTNQHHANALDCEQSASKQGVRIRYQGNVFRYQKNKNSEDPSLNPLRKTLSTDKVVPIPNPIEQNDLSHYNQERFTSIKTSTQVVRENITPESSGAAIVANQEIQNSSSSCKAIQNSSSSDSDEDSSSSDDSSSSSSSNDSKKKTGESDSSSSKLKITEQKEEIDHSALASSHALKKITNVDVEVITLDSSSDEDLLMHNTEPMDDYVNVVRTNGLSVQNKVDCVQPRSNSVNSGQVKSIFDPVEDCELSTREMGIDVESKTHDAPIPAVAKNCMNVTTNDPCLPSSSNSLVGKIRVKSFKELVGLDSEIMQPENALRDISEPKLDNPVQLQSNSSLTNGSSTDGKVEETNTGENGVDIYAAKIIETLGNNLRKVLCTPVHKRSLYKVQSTIDIAKNVGESQANILKNQEKGIKTNNHNMRNSSKSQSEENASNLPSNLNMSSEPKRLQTTNVSAKDVRESHGKSLHNPPKIISKNQNLLCVQTGENRYIHQESNKSNTGKLTDSLVGNMSTIPQNSQIKKPVPHLVALIPTPVFLTPIASKVQVTNQMTPMRPPLVSGPDKSGNRSAVPLGDGQNSSAYRGMAIVSQTQEMPPDDIAAASTIVTGTTENSKQTFGTCQSQETNPHLMNRSSVKTQELFFKLCDELFTEVICLKIPKMVDDLHLAIVHDEFKEERLKKTEQLLSPETIQSEKTRAERDFNEQIRIRAHSFVPLFITVVNKIKKNNMTTLVIALYIRFINQLQTIDPKYMKYCLTLRHIIKAMLQKSGSNSNDLCQILSDNDSSFQQNYLFIEDLLKKYDLYVEQQRVQKQTNNQQVGLTKSDANKNTEEHSIQQSKTNDIEQQVKSTGKTINTCTTITGSFSCSTQYPANHNQQQIASTLSGNVRNPIQIEPTSSSSSESTQQKNLDDIMFDAFFKTQ